MKLATAVSILALTAPLALAAQEAEKPAESYIYSTYFYCNTATQEQADELVMKNTAPIYDAAVADGTITAWGWLAHHTGGKWRRVQYHSSPTIEGLFAAQDTLQERMEAAGVANDGFAQICSAHDDYIWKAEVGNTLQVERGKAGLSVYEVCDTNREERALEIVKTLFAPIMEKAVADGKLNSWGWSSHVLGGEYRALQTMTAKDIPTLMKTRAELIEAIYGDGDNAVANEYSEICGSHSDYLWDIQHEKR
jgi:hypothetical protein